MATPHRDPAAASRRPRVATLSLITGCLLLALAAFGIVARAASGDPDPTFNGTGTVMTAIGASDLVRAVAIQNDGRIIVVGQTSNGAQNVFALARYNADGSLDTSFNTTGRVLTPIGSDADARAVAIQADGRIVVAGSTFNGAQSVFALARYDTSGHLDTSFNNSGMVTTTIGSSDVATAVAIQTDQRIVVGGYSSNGAQSLFAVARYTTNGSLDPSWNVTGIATTAIGAMDDYALAMAIQPNGRVVLAGYSGSPAYTVIALARYDTGGNLDPSFNTTGTVTTPIGISDVAYSVAVQSDKKIVVGGYNYSGHFEFALLRYKEDGTPDDTFGAGGVVTTDLGSSAVINSVALQKNGKIVAAGYYNASPAGFLVARYGDSGTLDATFGGTGQTMVTIGTGDVVPVVAIQPDSRIVIAGLASDGTQNVFALARVLGDPAVSVTLGGSGAGSVASVPDGISCGTDCDAGFVAGAPVTLNAVPVAGSVFSGWLGGCTGTAACQIVLLADTSVSATFAPAAAAPLRVDVDGNAHYDALTDGLIVLRYLFGLTGSALTNGALGTGATLSDPALLLAHLNDIRPIFDVDGNGRVDALTDGLLLIRYLFGLHGVSVTTGAVAPGASRPTALEIEPYIQSIMP